MQVQVLPDPSTSLNFDHVVPKATSNSHVASAALYHCLGTSVLLCNGATWAIVPPLNVEQRN